MRRATALRPCKYTGYFRYFYPRSPCGERQQYSRCRTRRTKFLSTLSLRRATVSSLDMQGLPDYFYPRSPCGERRGSGTTCIAAPTFLSTLSLRRATSLTRTPSAVTPISIHALLAESDATGVRVIKRYKYFYPRSPCGERQVVAYFFAPHVIFLSTLSLRRATMWYQCNTVVKEFLSTLSLRRATNTSTTEAQDGYISIHALLAESDLPASVRYDARLISIHALLAESDWPKKLA